MQTQLAEFIKDTDIGREADAILRKCVHCGFCTATCPTYQLLGDELDGPRGRIYLIKQMLEGAPVTEKTQLHLDRCLTCRSCESTCPSGVAYGRLVDLGRVVVDQKVKRPLATRTVRWALRELVSRPKVFGAAMAMGRMARPLLPAALKEKVPPQRAAGLWPQAKHSRRMLALAGCAQPAMMPSVNAATARVLDTIGISLVEASGAGCCGAVRHHLDDHAGSQADAKRNIDAWWPLIERSEVEALVMTASACGLQVKDYAHLLRDDVAYAEKAAGVSAMTKDVGEVIAAELQAIQARLPKDAPPRQIAFHAPCTLQHGQKLKTQVEAVLLAAGFELTTVPDAHLCCGSAGTYSILQPELSMQLRERKLAALSAGGAKAIASANVGCISHLAGGTDTPVRHWIEWLDERLNG
ncbi:glycolate oxidase subunit GlcF [Nitrogeniibacter aestuarii]|uniref:glycolate oxidase subunit GlcF n=1 Tax=Nitrogeniibacter aestuarii TaxID=2815343 RepID=UPI001E34E6B3|nr:glycolate oxidase subunit GlcF [Nitrogeniibacter aestuarii]